MHPPIRPRFDSLSAPSRLIVLAVGLLVWSASACAATFGDFTYTDDGTAVTITGYTGTGGAVEIPGTILGHLVTAIGDAAFQNCTSLTSLTSVTFWGGMIGAHAFDGCTGLTSIPILSGMIGTYAFRNCTSLASVTFGGAMIGDYAFQGCTNLVLYFQGGPPAMISNWAFPSNVVYYYHPSLWPASAAHGFYPLGQGIPYPLQIIWPAPAAITYGTPLSSAQLKATNTENVTGIYDYSPSAGRVLGAGTHTLSVTFQPFPAGSIYSFIGSSPQGSVTLVVNKATPAVAWATPAATTLGVPLSATQLNATTNVPGTFSYSPGLGSTFAEGTHTLSVTFTPTDPVNYTTANASVSLTVSKTIPTITWPTPAAIAPGTPLSAAQQNATANVPGTFTYSPALGSTLGVGTQTLTVTFSPADTASYANATAWVSLSVLEPRLRALSVRGFSGAGENTLITGIVLSGGSKLLVSRGIGPSLAQYGVRGFLGDPLLRLFNGSGTQLQANDDWGGSVTLANAFAAVGLPPLAPDSKDAALLATLNAGNYTAQLTATSGPGIGLMELYDTGTAGDGARIKALSVRGAVGGGENVLVVGFVVSGAGTERILIRGIGPGLAASGVPGALADPQLKVFNSSGAQVDANDDWDGGSALVNAFAAVGLAALPAGSKDAALIAALPVGVYTAQLSGVNSTAGVGLIELYEMP